MMIERLGVVLACAACGKVVAPTPLQEPNPPQENVVSAPLQESNLQQEDVATAVLRTVALHELKATDVEKPVCLALRGGSEQANATVLAAVRSKYPRAVPDSECSGGGPDGSSVRAPGGLGVRIDIGPVAVIGADGASCNGGGAYVSGGAREIRYTLARNGGSWSITDEKLVREM